MEILNKRRKSQQKQFKIINRPSRKNKRKRMVRLLKGLS